MTQQEPVRLKCPNCGRFLGVVDGSYFEAVPCNCGWQTTVKRGARVEKPAEVKSARG